MLILRLMLLVVETYSFYLMLKKRYLGSKCCVDCVRQPSGRNRVFTVGTGSVVLNARRYCRLHFSAILVSVTRVTFNAGFKHRTAFNTKMSTVYT